MSGRGLGFFAIVTVVASVGCSSSPTAPESARPDDPRTLQAAAHLDCETAEDIRALIDALEEDGTLNSGRATALRNKLDQAERHESAGRTEEAMEAYARLIAQVEEGVADGVLSEEGAADLLACAEDVLDGPDPVESFAYVTNIGSNNVSVIDIATNTVNATVAVGFLPERRGDQPRRGLCIRGQRSLGQRVGDRDRHQHRHRHPWPSEISRDVWQSHPTGTLPT